VYHLSTQCIYVLGEDLSANRDYFIMQHELIGFDNCSEQPCADDSVMLVLRGRIGGKERGLRSRHVGAKQTRCFYLIATVIVRTYN